MGNWHCIEGEAEKAGFEPRLMHAGKAKLMLGMAGTLPTVWIPLEELLGRRELLRARMVLVGGEGETQAKGSTSSWPSTGSV